MEKLKKVIRRHGGEKVQKLIIMFLRTFGLKNRIILFSTEKAKPNKVNLNYWSGTKNLGDAISPVIVNYVAAYHGINIDQQVNRTKHLYAVGSIITAGSQDCTIWGSGLLNTQILFRLKGRKLDIRSVRGPLTRMVLLEHGFEVPSFYGDPAILMPQIYDPEISKKYDVSVVTHMDEKWNDVDSQYHQISIKTDDYKRFVEEIKASRLIVSSSLHGIILAESYGVPAILLKPQSDLFKYYDYYYSTKRYEFPVANTVEEAKRLIPPEIPDYSVMRKDVISTFPVDLWKSNV